MNAFSVRNYFWITKNGCKNMFLKVRAALAKNIFCCPNDVKKRLQKNQSSSRSDKLKKRKQASHAHNLLYYR